MEAMSIEQMLLASCENQGYIGKTRVPVGSSDIDVLAINQSNQSILIGECKVREGSQRVYVVDAWNVATLNQPEADFERWLEEGWSKWLKTLENLWDAKGCPATDWLPCLDRVKVIKVVFCCNLYLFTDKRSDVDDALARAAEKHLRSHELLARRSASELLVQGEVKSTAEVIFELVRSVWLRIDQDKYSRRFGDPIKDLFRELHRYLNVDLNRNPLNERGEPFAGKKQQFAGEIRKQIVLTLLDALGIQQEEMGKWLNATKNDHRLGAMDDDPREELPIRKTPGVCGGDACIRNTRIMVWLLVSLKRQRMTDEDILSNYPTLTSEDLAAAWEYFSQNPQEIEEAIAANEVEA